MLTLEEYLRKSDADGAIDHMMRCRIVNGQCTFYIHPHSKNGDTCDFLVEGNMLSPDPNVTYG